MNYLEQLSNAIGISGKEGAVRDIVLSAIEGHVTDIKIDGLGGVTAIKKGTGENLPRVMIAAHMDEIGFMVTGIDNNGFIQFANIGGIDDRILPGLRVKVGDKGHAGVIMWTPIHYNREQNVVPMKNLRIDIGAKDKASANGLVKLGDSIAFDSTYSELSETVVRGKAFDDRVGCSILIDILQGGPYPVDIIAAFTVQEEVGLRGAKVATQIHNPDVAFILEGTTAHDVPNPLIDPDHPQENNPGCVMGGGPALTVMDRSAITNPKLLNFFRKTAETHTIPYQLKTQLGGGTDGGAIHITAGGCPTNVISMPCRYIHSPAALLSKTDYHHAVELTKKALEAITFEDFKHD